MTHGGATAAYAALLDRSFARIGELAADGRAFDRAEVAAIADVWDNNTFPFFRVALSRPSWVRERRARAALRWMAAPGPSRRAWMVSEAAAAGHDMEPILGAPTPTPVHHRGQRGRVFPGTVALDPAATTMLGKDYRLDRAEVKAVRVERAGPQTLSGYAALAAPRRYAAPGAHDEPILRLLLTDVRTAHFDSGDIPGASVTFDGSAVDIRLGARSHFRAASATVGINDSSWYLSHAGRAANGHTPRRLPNRRPPRAVTTSSLPDAAAEAALAIHEAMLKIRMVRYAHLVGRTPLRELAAAGTNAGAAVLAAASVRRPAQEREFRRLTRQWLAASPSLAESRPGRQADPRERASGLLTLVAYGDDSAVVNLAAPRDDGTWELCSEEMRDVRHLTFGTEAFAAPHPVHRTAKVVTLAGGACVIR